LRDLTRIQELGQVEMLAELLRTQVGQLTSYSYLAKNVRVSVDTVRRWIATLESLYYCFTVKPWHRNIARALRKEPKYYLWDWSQVDDAGARAENLVASALLKAAHWWTETGQGEFGLHFIRDKQKREVDFVVTRNQQPWILVEVKSSEKAQLSDSLSYFQKQTRAEHAFQLAMEANFIERDCFEHHDPIIVPASTLLAQLV
jgi:predicted AAA+ superfamily ATPase